MADTKIYRASTTAPVNIAVIKYWGKRDATLNLPTNSSLSVTLSQSNLRTHTTASCSASYPPGDSLLLNGQPQPLTTPRSLACLSSLRALRTALEAADPALPKLSTYPLRLVSTNNFPTAAGLASSAAGFAALVRAIANLYALPHSPTELSLIARQGSGSACRSLLGGYVAWDRGSRADGTDSIARLVAPRAHWPDMRAMILVVSAARKSISSSAGMQATVHTSPLFQTRHATVVPARMATMEAAIAARNFSVFAHLTMRDSNSFHATCLDTDPPIFYLNDVSRAAIRAVETLNAHAGRCVAAYTFDAGPNAVVYFLEGERTLVMGWFRTVLAEKEGWVEGEAEGEGLRETGEETFGKREQREWEGDSKVGKKGEDDSNLLILREGVSRVILTSVGEGPISVDEHLIDEQGNPVDDAGGR